MARSQHAFCPRADDWPGKAQLEFVIDLPFNGSMYLWLASGPHSLEAHPSFTFILTSKHFHIYFYAANTKLPCFRQKYSTHCTQEWGNSMTAYVQEVITEFGSAQLCSVFWMMQCTH